MLKEKFKAHPLSLILNIYILSVGIFSLFRLVLFFTEFNRININSETIGNIIYSFIMGIRFDNVITGYVMLVPSLVILISYTINFKNKIVFEILFYWIFTLFILGYSIASADIPYFNQFFSRFSIEAFTWFNNPGFVFNMIIQEPKYLVFIFLFFVIIFFYYKGLRFVFSSYLSSTFVYSNKKSSILLRSLISIVILLFVFIGVRGRTESKSPIRLGTAYFCNDPFLNQLGLNPVFTFMRSAIDATNPRNNKVNLMDENIAINNTKSYLKIEKSKYSSIIARDVLSDSSNIIKPNIVVVIMESMSAAKMTRYGGKNNLTPFLDSLSYQSYTFDNIYSAGKHTFNGIFSTLCSFPSLYRQHTMNNIREYMGMSTTLKEIGYSTTFFINHDSQFDNIEGFMYANQFDNVISQLNYPPEEVKSTLGVPDDFMFRYSVPILDELSKTKDPFFVTFMTASDHPPRYIPSYFLPHSKEKNYQSVEYADWSIKKFINLSSKTEWFDNTIFIFIADHGNAMNVKYSVPLSYHHVPMIVYAPKILLPRKIDKIGGQIDLFPTVMGIINQPYVNNTLGIDLLKEDRSYIVFNEDDRIASIDNEFLFVLKEDNSKELFKYRNGDQNNYLDSFPNKSAEMEIYLKSYLQTYQYILDNNMTSFDID